MAPARLAILLGLIGAQLSAAVPTQVSSSVTTSASSAASPIVSIAKYGNIQGNISQYNENVYTFKYVPYGGAMTGTNRWKHALHPTAWNETRDATKFGPPCPQLGVANYSEDCLYLNVWTPRNATLNDVVTADVGVSPSDTNSKLPVYVYFHGGFNGGYSSDPRFDGTALAAKGVVVVTTNFRIGALGWLAHPELSANSSSGTSGNYALVDQQASLHWTNEQIANFGGDPSRITIGGAGEGGAAVLDQINSGLAADLFEQAIAESAAIYPSDPFVRSAAPSYRHLAEAEAQGVAYLASLNISNITEAYEAPVEVFLAAAALKDNTTWAGTVFENSSIYTDPPLFRPVLDGYVLPATYQKLLETGDHNIAPVLQGANKDQWGSSTDPGFTVASYESSAKTVFGNLTDEYLQYYASGSNAAAADDSSNAFYQDQTRISSWSWASQYVAGSERNTSGNGNYSTYSYFWTHAPPGQDAGAYDGSQIQYAFDNLDIAGSGWTADDYAIADTLSTYWVNFISTGDPNGAGLPVWSASSAANATVFEVGDAFRTIAVADAPRIAFVKEWWSRWTAY